MQKVTFQIQKFLWLKRLKILFGGYVISDVKGKEIVGTYYEKEFQKTNQK